MSVSKSAHLFPECFGPYYKPGVGAVPDFGHYFNVQGLSGQFPPGLLTLSFVTGQSQVAIVREKVRKRS